MGFHVKTKGRLFGPFFLPQVGFASVGVLKLVYSVGFCASACQLLEVVFVQRLFFSVAKPYYPYPHQILNSFRSLNLVTFTAPLTVTLIGITVLMPFPTVPPSIFTQVLPQLARLFSGNVGA